MCFSATASLTAAAGLSIIGLICVMRAHKNKNLLPFAAIPFLFAIQQATEGIVWLSFTHESFAPYQTIASYAFLFFASFLWPVWAPFAAYRIEPNASRKQWLKKIIPVGALVGCVLFGAIVIQGVSTQVLSCHIAYSIPIEVSLQWVALIAYSFVTIVPLLRSSIALVRFLGAMLVVAYGISYFFYYASLNSVWCFLAAILSALILKIVVKRS
jgi:hypothetical protein